LYAFQVCGSGAEVAKACVFHAGVVSLSYTTQSEPPELTLSTWEGSLATGQVDILQKNLPLPAGLKGGLLVECMAIQGVPRIRSPVAQFFGALQVNFFSFQID
jgi:hypothetical protein